jgi:cation:H+ antiporter
VKTLIVIIFVLILSAVLIYFSCELFVNAIEWFGRKTNISRNAVGTILAAFGTALPESVVTFVAVVFGKNPGQKEIGIGAALGGPLVLSTLAYAVVGFSIMAFRKQREMGSKIDLSDQKLGRDQLWFLIIFFFKVGLGFVLFNGKSWLGLLFIAAYAIYCYIEMSAKAEVEAESLEPLRFRPKQKNPEFYWVLFQTMLSLGLIFMGSQIFVNRLEAISKLFGVPAHIIALFLSPIATELPEVLNAVIWVRQGKERLALGNISGAMMIQATIPTAFGLLFTPWLFDSYLFMGAISTVLSILFLWTCLHNKRFSAKKLLIASVFYGVFIAGVIIIKITRISF